MNATDIQAVREVLARFQDGYERRETALLPDFRSLFVTGDDLEIIGTGAIEPGDDEWALGLDATAAFIQNDWEGWGDLVLDVADARIHVLGDVAWLATTGTVTMDLDPADTCGDFLDYIGEVVKDEKLDARTRLLEVLRGGANTLFEAERGKQYIWPLRFTAVLTRRPSMNGGNRWLFHQIQFSFATTRFPDVRNV